METPTLTIRRDPLFDVVKALMMLWVVWGHLARWEVVAHNPESFIRMANAKIGVNMPIFFVIGGYLALLTFQNGSWSKIIARIVGFFWSIAGFGVLFAVLSALLGNQGCVSFYRSWIHNGGHWFLRSFAALYVLSALVYRTAQTDRHRWVGFIALYATLVFTPIRYRPLLSWLGGSPTIHMMPYFVFGLMVLRKREWWRSNAISLCCGTLFIAAVFLQGNSSTNGMNFWKVSPHWQTVFGSMRHLFCAFARTSVGVTGSVFVLWLFDRLLVAVPKLTSLAVFGTTTLGVYILHWWPMILVAKGFPSSFPLPDWTHWPVAIVWFLASHWFIAGIRRIPILSFFFFGDERRFITSLDHASHIFHRLIRAVKMENSNA